MACVRKSTLSDWASVALVAPRASARTIQPLRYPIRPDTEKIVFGVDTHKHVYLGAFITFGELIETQSFPTAREGRTAARVRWVRRRQLAVASSRRCGAIGVPYVKRRQVDGTCAGSGRKAGGPANSAR
jgi:hypothetical protein